MPPLAFYMPSFWELIILGSCCMVALGVVAAVAIVLVLMYRKQQRGQGAAKGSPGRPQEPPPGAA